MALDKRINAFRPGLAAASLRGQVDAVRFVEGEKAMVIRGRASLRAAPSHDAAQDSELLCGENVMVYARADGWAWVQAENDRYVGYLRESALDPVFAPDATVTAVMTPLLAAPDAKSQPRDMLPMNARLRRGDAKGNFIAAEDGFVSARALAPLAQKDFVAVAERFLGVPYVWGGKTFAGLDCSGLIQTALNACGLSSPRDSDMMENGLGVSVAQNDLRRGDLIFWKGHVGVMQDAGRLLHANAYFMAVTSEPLADALARIETPPTAIKRL